MGNNNFSGSCFIFYRSIFNIIFLWWNYISQKWNNDILKLESFHVRLSAFCRSIECKKYNLASVHSLGGAVGWCKRFFDNLDLTSFLMPCICIFVSWSWIRSKSEKNDRKIEFQLFYLLVFRACMPIANTEYKIWSGSPKLSWQGKDYNAVWISIE